MIHTIWTNDLNYEDWRADLEELCPDAEGCNEDERIRLMYEYNDFNLEDEKDNLDIDVGHPLIMIGTISLWYGRREGYKILKSTNLKDIFDTSCGDYVTWYTEDNELKCKDCHHDGTNYYTYRILKIDPDEFEEYICDHALQEAIDKYTEPAGTYVDQIYGWEEKK